MAASTSTAAASNNNTCCDVFISHGPDVEKTLASHLYCRLRDKVLRVFLGYKKLQEGEDFPCEIKSAISAASLHVAIFSPTYADSQLCLDELVLMLESGTPIIPVFHDVKPTDLRRTRGDGVYATSLSNLQNKRKSDSQPRYDSETIENWRNALSQVPDISGLELEAFNGDEGELVEKIVKVVLREGVKTPLNVARYPAGLEEKVQDFETKVLFQQRRGRVQVVLITGLGGVGKTTLAIELFNRMSSKYSKSKSSEYSKSYFLSDVRENAKKSLHSLQSQLLNGLLQSELHIDNKHAGIEKLKKHLSSCKVLLVLDDVDHQDQVLALLPLDVLHHDSLILITSRDKDVLARSGVQEPSIYELSGLDTQRSRELFCSHAFHNPHPLPEFESLVDEFLKACNGLPLSLKVFGGLLYGNTNKSYWESELEALKKTLPHDIQKSLQISYDALDKDEKQIFLDIACFFIGIDRDTAISVWDGSGWNGKRGFQSLMNKCLVEVYMEDNYEQGVKMHHLIRMHDHLRDMGRDLANTPGFPCRLWCGTKHMEDLLQQSSSEATKVRGIRMSRWEHYDERSDTDEDDERASFSRYKMKNLQILDIQKEDDLLKCLLERVDSPKLLYLRWRKCPCSSLPPYIPMKKLRVLDVEGSKLKTLWKEDLQAPLQLRELRIRNFGPFKIPKSIGQLKHLERMVVDAPLPYGIPRGFCYLRSLKHLVLHEVSFSSLTDSFGNLSKLEYIDLSNCDALERLPDSFGNLSRLEYIDLSSCVALKTLPDSFRNLSRLEHINLSYCRALERLPDSFGNLSKLEHINLSECCALETLPDSFGNLSRLEHINLSECRALERLPDSFGNLSRLEHINLSECHALKRLPNSLGNLSRLEDINLFRCSALESLPDSLGNLSRLEHINLSACRALDRLPDSFGNLSRLEHINLSKCWALERLPDSFGNLSRLKHIDLSECRALERLPDSFGNLSRLEHINLSKCHALKRLPDSFGNLSRLEHINLFRCYALERLPDSFGNLSRLEHINLCACRALKRLPDSFGNLIKLEYLDLQLCDKLTIPGGTFREIDSEYMYFPEWRIEVFPPQIAHQWSLKKELLCLINLTEWPSATGEACHLETLVLQTPFLEALPPSFGNDLRNLRYLELRSCRSLKRLPDSFLLLNQLVDLTVKDCSPELDFKAVEGENETSTDSGGERTSSNLERFLPRLQSLTLHNTHISEVSFPTCVCPDLQYLDIRACPDLVEVTLPNALRSLNLYKCSKLRKIGAPFPTGACHNLQDLHIMKCNDLMPNASFKDRACLMTSRHGLEIKVEISNFSKLRKIGGSFPTGVCPNFQDLRIKYCENLVELEILPTAIQHLSIQHCENLVELEILPTAIQHLKIRKCEELVEFDCQELVEVGTLPNALLKMQLINCPKTREIEQLCGFTKLRTLEVSRRKEVEKLPSIECNTETLRESRGQRALSNSDSLFDKCLLRLQHLELDNLQISQVSFPTGVCPNLQHLHIRDCEDLIEVQTLPNALIKLQLDRCPKLRLIRIEELAQVMQLREMRVGVCDGLEEMVGVGYLKSLEVMQVILCRKLKIIQGLEQLTQLRELDFSYCFELEELLGVGHLKSLEVFKATMCQRLKSIRGLEQLTLLRLRELDISYCSELETLS